MYTRRARMTPLSPPAAACGLKGKLTEGDEKSLTLLKHHFASRTCQSMALDNRKSIPAPALSKFLSFYSVHRKRSNASLTREPISINHSVPQDFNVLAATAACIFNELLPGRLTHSSQFFSL